MQAEKIPYYPGCTLNTVAKGLDTSARQAALTLGFELEELDTWNCCGASFPLTPDNIIGLTAPAKVLLEARRHGEESLLTLCSVCYNVLKRTNRIIREDSEKREVINGFMEEEYDGSLKVLHFLEFLRDRVGFDRLKEAVKRPLKGLKTGGYYGCMLLRPADVMDMDDHEAPTILEGVLGALGAEPIDFPDRIECCGSHLAIDAAAADVVTKLCSNVISSAVKRGAEVIVTSCPLCQYNLDRSQTRLASASDGYRPVPVVYFTQLLAVALGQSFEDACLDKNTWDVRPLIGEKGV